jgi:glycosyltransferase involved in cell wall biosynthesis
VLVVDDGSSDSTPDVVAQYSSHLTLRYFTQQDAGYRAAKARNVGIANASSDICVFLDCGVIAHSECLRAHVDVHAAQSCSTAVCGYVYGLSFDDHNADEIRKGIDLTRLDEELTGLSLTSRWEDPRETFYRKYSDSFGGLPAPWVVYWTCNASARTRQLCEVGMFDEAYRSWGAEDIDLGYRLHRAGARFVLSREAASLHWPHPKDRAANTASLMDNYAYFRLTYDDPAVRLVGRVPLFEINDLLL